ncbi:lipocalin-like domain-containing protein [Accumulibacter sp.]|uniref:lipocalin-like domain-containing protein n=1 Tax=Accumulibacter sp. TaxID=2053492 RepID=UPI0025E8E1B2|nr:lipocalin-like domain-containing protein [Accumulibacter sp.]MCM8595549.1 carotenoid 1,2-hydratase [Accumulibacter sp.]MCM8627279.1 carotenoid 1,2-hydratase [Accumulibacter sp.]MDS4049697.1 lipocalin-like domain-containing protein [Accumulibacter sp.]
MDRRRFLVTPLLLPGFARSAASDSPSAGAVVYAEVEPGRKLVFPRDHGAHPDFRTEWWYVTGALDEPADSGFQLTFFRSRPGIAEELRSPIAARQIVFAHAALTLPGVGLRHAERAARAGLGSGLSSEDCDVWLGPWRLRRLDSPAGEFLRLQMNARDFAFDLTLAATRPLLLQGRDGYSRKDAAGDLASHYVSWPQLRVSGRLLYDGKGREASGKAWFDHEWSTRILGSGAVGWDWIGINLADGGALMAFRLRSASGATLHAHAAWRDAAGRLRQFDGPEVVFTPLRNWQSARSGASYPVEIGIRIGELGVRTVPIVDDQELSVNRPARVVYWEGLVRVEGSLSGRGYLELTGYAGRVPLAAG